MSSKKDFVVLQTVFIYVHISVISTLSRNMHRPPMSYAIASQKHKSQTSIWAMQSSPLDQYNVQNVFLQFCIYLTNSTPSGNELLTHRKPRLEAVVSAEFWLLAAQRYR